MLSHAHKACDSPLEWSISEECPGVRAAGGAERAQPLRVRRQGRAQVSAGLAGGPLRRAHVQEGLRSHARLSTCFILCRSIHYIS